MANMGTVIDNYTTFSDYALLARLARKQSIICIIDYSILSDGTPVRDAAQTQYEDDGQDLVYQIRGRGIVYIYALGEEDFMAQCASKNVAFILPV